MRKSLVFAFYILLISVSSAQNPHKRQPATDPSPARLPGPAIAAMQTINSEHIRADVRFLSHDLLEGRGTGQRGETLRRNISPLSLRLPDSNLLATTELIYKKFLWSASRRRRKRHFRWYRRMDQQSS